MRKRKDEKGTTDATLKTARDVEQKLLNISLETIDAIHAIAQDQETNPATRLQAGQTLLKLAQPIWEKAINQAKENEQNRRNLENWADMAIWPKAE